MNNLVLWHRYGCTYAFNNTVLSRWETSHHFLLLKLFLRPYFILYRVLFFCCQMTHFNPPVDSDGLFIVFQRHLLLIVLCRSLGNL